MERDERTCGRELAEDAEVPELLGQLWEHVATNMLSHAKSVGTGTPAAAAEHDALVHIAREYRNIAAAAERAATIMKSLHDLPPAPHEPARHDRPAQARFIRHKIDLQLRLADLLVSHAEASRAGLLELETTADE